MEWVRAWFNPLLDDAMTYISILLTQIIEEAWRDGLEVFVDFVHNKYGELPNLDITILIVTLPSGYTLEYLCVRGSRLLPL